jgi:polyhydroxyalkanoate synthesis regulator phasin
MSELISKALLSGLGLASLTKDAIQKTAEDFVKKSDLSEEEGRKLVKELHKRSAKARKELEKNVGQAVNNLLKHVNLELVRGHEKAAKTGTKRPAKSARATKTSKA